MSLLARALGKLLAQTRGLKRLQLPAALGDMFAEEVVYAVNKQAGALEAAIISLQPRPSGPYLSPERAAELRSRDDESDARALIINFTGEYREWNTLEPFRLLNPSLLPSGLLDGTEAELSFLDLAGLVVDEMSDAGQALQPDSHETVASLVFGVAKYLAESYAEYGNADVAWDHAWWLHIDSMLDAAMEVISKAPHKPVDNLDFEAALFGAAGLPAPATPGGAYRKGRIAPKFAKILRDRWAKEELAISSARDLARDWVATEEGRTLEQFPLVALLRQHDLTDAIAQTGHPLLALSLLGEISGKRANAWALVGEDPFFLPTTETVDGTLQGLDEDGDAFELLKVGDKQQFHVLPPPAPMTNDGQLQLGRYVLEVGTKLPIELGLLQFSCNPPTLQVSLVDEPLDVGGGMRLVFDLSLEVAPSMEVWRELPHRIDILAQEVGGDNVTRSVFSLDLLVPFPGRTSFLLFESKKAGKDGRRCLPPDRDCTIRAEELVLGNEPGEPRELQLRSGVTRLNIYAVGSQVIPAPHQVGWSAASALGDFGAFQATGIVVPEELQVGDGGDAIAIALNDETETPISPIVAAALDSMPSDHPGEEDTLRASGDPRTIIEAWQGENFVIGELTDEFKESLGQIHFAVDYRGVDAHEVIQHGPGAYTLGHVIPVTGLPAELAGNETIQQFWEAFKGLGLGELCAEKQAITSTWPSKLDLRQLDEELLKTYLDAYSALLDQAKVGQQYRLLAFPFSCIAFSPVDGKVRGILLTALHPLRLAWNWAAQQAGKSANDYLDSSEVLNLLRFVDGSELPCVGPALSHGDAYHAVPLAAGPGGLFATWSFLSSSTGLDGLASPTMGGLAFPTGALSGLNADSVGAAMRDYLRVNPYVTSLDIGLHSMGSRARSTELDDAIVSQLDDVLSGGAGDLPGGVRVLDSPTREGSPPARQEVLARVTAAMENRHSSDKGSQRVPSPFAWVTAPDQAGAKAPDVDLRFLEDSLVDLSVGPGPDTPVGHSVVPTLPVARRSVWEHSNGEPSQNFTLLGAEQADGLSGFAAVVDRFEQLAQDGSPIRRLASIPAAATLMDRKARWLVAGNMNLDPRALSSALGNMGTGALLWEWRPPYMERRVLSVDSIVPARPYAVIANPSPDFLSQVQSCIDAVAGGPAETNGKDVLNELGNRGVGLASLLAMGHQQSRGAIGFFAAFKMLATWENEAADDELRMVLPLDAINPVIQLLAGNRVGEATRKADLLLLEATKAADGFTLMVRPIEIKMHAAKVSLPHAFPSPNSAGIADAMEQLNASADLLAKFVERMAKINDVALLQAALTALLETSISLAENAQGSISRELMVAAASGNVSIATAPGVLFWFEAAGTDDGLPYKHQLSQDSQSSQLMVDPRILLGGDGDHDAKSVAALLRAILVRPAGDDAAPAHIAPLEGQDAESGEPEHGEAEGDETRSEARRSSEPPPVVSDEEDARVVVEEPVATAGNGGHALKAQALATGIPVHVGWTKEGLSEEPLFFDPRDTRINQLNMGVVGDLGTGKTQFLKSLVYQLTLPVDTQAAAPKVFVFDYKRDYVDQPFVEMTGAKVLDPSRTPIPLNFFAVPEGASQFEVTSRALLFADTIDKIYSIGPRQQNALRTAVIEAYAARSDGPPMLADVLAEYQANVSDNDSVVSALQLMVQFGLFEADPAKLVDFDTLFDRNVILALGNIADAGVQVQNLLVTLFLNLLHVDYMKKREKHPFVEGSDGITRRTIDSFVLVDEAHNIMDYEFESLRKLLLEGREFGMGVILSSQYLSHFKTRRTNWAEPLLTWVIHKVPRVTPADLSALGIGKDLDLACQRIPTLEVHRSLFKSPIGKAREGVWLRDKPFYEFLS